jgi:hypothetical protein
LRRKKEEMERLIISLSGHVENEGSVPPEEEIEEVVVP